VTPSNILILMSDQHSPHAVGCDGNNPVRTPHLDRLAKEGMRFTNTYCPAPLCVPSRMSFMTSRTPSRNRVWNNQHALGSGIPTWAHALGAVGYETALIGRMHFVGADQRHGFERRPMGEFMAGHHGRIWLGGPAWTKYPAITTGQKRPGVEHAGTGHTVYQWFDERAATAACHFLRERCEKGVGDPLPGGPSGASHKGSPTPFSRPFAAVVGFMLPHCPFIAPKELFEYYYDRIDVPEADEGQPATVKRFRRLRGILDPPLPAERIRIARAAYFALCEYLDSLIGRILDCLDETGLAENTLVIYTSDHGEMAGEHGCWWKSNYYEGSACVPMIARLPNVVPAGGGCDAICNLMDVGPTLAEIAGAEMPDADGRSLWPTLQGNHPDDWPDETLSEFVDSRTGDAGLVNLPSRMIRSGPWKLWHYADAEDLPPALFNLDDDPGEVRDLGTEPAYADIRTRLLERLHDGWDPARASALSAEQDRDERALAAWGKAVKPPHEDTLLVPPPDVEADVELL